MTDTTALSVKITEPFGPPSPGASRVTVINYDPITFGPSSLPAARLRLRDGQLEAWTRQGDRELSRGYRLFARTSAKDMAIVRVYALASSFKPIGDMIDLDAERRPMLDGKLMQFAVSPESASLLRNRHRRSEEELVLIRPGIEGFAPLRASRDFTFNLGD